MICVDTPAGAIDDCTGRRKKAQYRPSKVVTMSTTSQPSADFFVSSDASASGLELNGLNATYSNMDFRLVLGFDNK